MKTTINNELYREVETPDLFMHLDEEKHTMLLIFYMGMRERITFINLN